jgi:acyl-CoA thioesterase-1
MKPWLLSSLAVIVTINVAFAQVEAPPLSKSCEAPNADIAVPAPLPRLMDKLERKASIRILAMGSSSTWGVGASSQRRTYPAQLQEILQKALTGIDARIVNRGVSGEVAQTTADRLRTEVAVSRPDLVLWQLGTNDALARVPTEDFERTVSTTVKWLKSNNIDVALVGLQYTPNFARDENYLAIREALRRVSTAQDVLYVRRYDAMRFISKANEGSDLVSGDDLQLNDLGYQCMAEHIAHAVIASLFLRRRDLPGPDTQTK